MWMAWLVTKVTSDVGDCSGITMEFSSGVSQEVLEDAVWKLQPFGVLEGLKLAFDKGFSFVEVQSDNKDIVDNLKGNYT